MPPEFARYVELVFRHCGDVSRFVRPFVADAEATRSYVRRVFVRGHAMDLLASTDPLPELLRIALHEVRRACPPRGAWLDLLAASSALSRAAYLLVHVQEVPVATVACMLQMTVGQTLYQAELASLELSRRVELATLAGEPLRGATDQRADALRDELPAPSWSGLEKARLCALIDDDLSLGHPLLVLGNVDLARAPFRHDAALPLPPPPAKSAPREQRRVKLRLVHALAPRQVPAPLPLLHGPLPIAAAPQRVLESTPPRLRRTKRPRLVLTAMAVLCMGLGALVAQAAPPLWRPAVITAPEVLREAPPATVRQARPILDQLRHAELVLVPEVAAPPPRATPSPKAAAASPAPASPPPSAPEPALEITSTPVALALPPPTTVRPSLGAVSVAFGRVKDRARACLGTDEAPSNVSVTFGADGSVQGVQVSGPAAFTGARSCIERAVSQARVPAFSEPEFVAKMVLRP